MKLRGSVHFLRIEIEAEKGISDQEFRLFQLYRRICVWDKRNSNFGTSNISIREIRKLYLPSWATGKISQVRAGLVRKNWLEKLNRTRYRIKEYKAIYRSRVREIEPYFQGLERGIHRNERAVQFVEQNKSSIGLISALNSIANVQSNEPAGNSKETIKKDKENINDSSLIFSKNEYPWRDPERQRALRESIKKNRAYP